MNFNSLKNNRCLDKEMACEPVYEMPKETVCHRYINYEVPHIMRCNTKVVNHHIFKHVFIPEYTCCEENEICHVYDECQKNNQVL